MDITVAHVTAQHLLVVLCCVNVVTLFCLYIQCIDKFEGVIIRSLTGTSPSGKANDPTAY